MQPGEVAYLMNGAFYKMRYVAWGHPSNPVVVCVHGLTRTGRDFDVLAEALSDQFYLVCPDLPGRGRSDWWPQGALYQPLSYGLPLSHLLAQLNREVAWIGTSLGGICGMGIAAAAQTPVTKLVLNDVGPFIPAAALKRIRDYMAMGAPPVFETAAQLVSFLRLVHAPFGDLTEAQWQQIGMPCARTLPDGTVTLHYDPRIAEPIAAAEPKDANLWPIYGAIKQPILAIRGVDSDLLLPDTLAQMAQMGAQTYVVEGAGHAPALMDDASIERIRQFLRG